MNQERVELRSSELTRGVVFGSTKILRKALSCALVFLAILSLPFVAVASTVTGKIINQTTGLPSPGDRVAIYRVDKSMHLEGRTTSDARGEFHFELPADARYIVAAYHQSVPYHTRVLRGQGPVEVSVYDAASDRGPLSEPSDTLFLQGEGSSLKVSEFFVLSNSSNRTLVGTDTFTFALPRSAVLDSVAVQAPNTLPVLVSAVRRGPGNRYGIANALRPGATKVRAVYHLPYSGQVPFTVTPLMAVSTMAVMVPVSMKMTSATPGALAYRGEQNRLAMYVASGLRPGRPVTFRISGTGGVTTSANEIIARVRSVPLHADLHVEANVTGQTLKPVLAWRFWLTVALSGLCATAFAFWKSRRPLARKRLAIER
jgi:hypothetical protein